MTQLSKRMELVILEDSDGPQVVSERRVDGLIEVSTPQSLDGARAWVEAHYAGVEWLKARLASALVGKLASGGDDTTQCEQRSRCVTGGDST
jgi:hypothetical protein